MKIWKAKINRGHGIWASEIRLREIDPTRRGKVTRLLAKLKKEGDFDESIS